MEGTSQPSADANVTEIVVLLNDLLEVAGDEEETHLLEAARDLLAATVEPFDADQVAAKELTRALPD